VSSILARADHHDAQVAGLGCRQIFYTVYRQVYVSSTQGMFDFGHENTIAANLRQRHIENMVATGANLLNGYLYVGPVLLQPRDHFVCLDHRQLAGSCPYRYALHQFVLPNQTSIVRLQRTHAPGLPQQLPSGAGWVYAIAYLPA